MIVDVVVVGTAVYRQTTHPTNTNSEVVFAPDVGMHALFLVSISLSKMLTFLLVSVWCMPYRVKM